jgi:dTMP kinase
VLELTQKTTRRLTTARNATTTLKSISSKQLSYYGEGISYLEDKEMKGRLIVIEGPDSSGRSTQITMITSKLDLMVMQY